MVGRGKCQVAVHSARSVLGLRIASRFLTRVSMHGRMILRAGTTVESTEAVTEALSGESSALLESDVEAAPSSETEETAALKASA